MYTYGTRLRPPDIWCVPKTGLKEVSSSEFTADGRHYWGSAVYDRELTKEELEHYDMDQINTVMIYGIRED